METKDTTAQFRLVECEVCGTKYKFKTPTKPGFFRIECPKCHEEKIFKVVI